MNLAGAQSAVPTLTQIKDPVTTDLEAVNRLIDERLCSSLDFINNMSRYIVASKGKQLRPLLVLLASSACGYTGSKRLLLAAIIEFIHTATLLHDDVVDSSRLRRGQQTAHLVWGNPASILLGDFLYSRAFQMIVEIGAASITAVLADTTNTIAEGEINQLLYSRRAHLDEADYLHIVYRKTACLFEAATRSSALLAQADNSIEGALADYGRHLGMAFQLVDDIHDYTGRAGNSKEIGDDLAEGRPTLPFIYALKHSDEEEKKVLTQALAAGDRSMAATVGDIIKRRGGIAYAYKQATHYANQAQALLDDRFVPSCKTALLQLAQFSVARDC